MKKLKRIGMVAVLTLALSLCAGGGVAQGAALTLSDTTVSGSGALTLTGATASTWSATTGDLTIDGVAGSLILDSGEATADAIRITASATAGGIDVDAGTGGINIATTSVSAGAVTIAASGGTNGTILIDADGTGTDAINIDSVGGIDIDTTAGVFNVATIGGDITLDATNKSVYIDGGEGVADAVTIIATTASGGIDITSNTGDLDIDSSGVGVINIGAVNSNTAALNIGTGNGARTITIGNNASAKVDINALIVELDSGGVIDIDATTTLSLNTVTGQDILIGNDATDQDILIGNTAATEFDATAILVDINGGATGITMDVAAGGLLSVDVAAPSGDTAAASNISVAAQNGTNAQTLTVALTGAADDVDDFTVSVAGAEGDLILSSGDDLTIDATGAITIGGTNGASLGLSKTGVMTTVLGTLNVDEAVTFDTTLVSTGLITGSVGFSSTAETVKPTASGAAITAGVTAVDVDTFTADVNDWITLPAIADVPVGHTIYIAGTSGANFEIRTPAASDTKINNVDADGSAAEYLGTDTDLIRVTSMGATQGWVAQSITSAGAVRTAVTPD